MISFKVQPDNGDEYEVTATTRDILSWETSGKDRSFQKLMENLRLTDMYELAWSASVRNGYFQGTVKSFKESVELVFEADDSNPTNEDR